MRIGLLAVATKTGLGYQTRAYYKHLKPDKTFLVDISPENGEQVYHDWYPDAERFKPGFPRYHEIMQKVGGIDVLITAETPYNYELYDICREKGIKTVCVPNWEFFDYFIHRDKPVPDLFLSPSVWHLNELKRFAESKGVGAEYLHLPVDRDEFPFKLREHGKPLHLAGKPAANDRNGTWIYMEAVPNGKVTTQDEGFARQIREKYRHSNVFTNLADPQMIYVLGDIMVLPRRYGGNCLPLNEALSSGMPVIMPDIEPNNHILPSDWLVPAEISGYFTPRTRIDLYDSKPSDIAERINYIQADIKKHSQKANEIADSISWETLKPKYIEMFESLL